MWQVYINALAYGVKDSTSHLVASCCLKAGRFILVKHSIQILISQTRNVNVSICSFWEESVCIRCTFYNWTTHIQRNDVRALITSS